jgi:hypothetical protein
VRKGLPVPSAGYIVCQDKDGLLASSAVIDADLEHYEPSPATFFGELTERLD